VGTIPNRRELSYSLDSEGERGKGRLRGTSIEQTTCITVIGRREVEGEDSRGEGVVGLLIKGRGGERIVRFEGLSS